jgi:two-component sensor histidine kinase
VVLVDPDSADRSKTPPRVFIEGLIADGMPVASGDLSALPPETRRVDFKFTALRFEAPGRVRFRHQLTGVDKDWVLTDGRRRTMTYAIPGYGDFSFIVSASVNDGPWNPAPAIITFSIAPHFYERRVFQAGCALIALFLLVSGYRLRTRRILSRNRMLEDEITLRRRAEEKLTSSLDEKTVMLKEIHHRVKNNMQVISSLMSLQLGASSEPSIQEALRESQTRIRSMALVHETLYRSDNFAAIDFKQYLERLVRQVHTSHSGPTIQVRVDGSDVMLPLDQAIPAGLMMNELISNAMKHGFPGGRQGTITVSAGIDDEGIVDLLVRDTGVGLPPGFEPEKVTSLGLHLVRSLTQQLDGTMSIDNGPGTSIHVRFLRSSL